MWLLIDDIRDPNDYNCDVVARNANAGILLLKTIQWEGVVMDNDLGEKTEGYQILEYALKRGILPSAVDLVTSNPVARNRMAQSLKTANYITVNGLQFRQHF